MGVQKAATTTRGGCRVVHEEEQEEPFGNALLPHYVTKERAGESRREPESKRARERDSEKGQRPAHISSRKKGGVGEE